MLVLVLNLGSSSLKAGLFETTAEQTLFELHLEHTDDLNASLDVLQQHLREHGHETPDAIGHRVVHGGPNFTTPALADNETLQAIEACVPLAPLHNPLNLKGLRATLQRWPDVPQVAVFDTAYHRSIPAAAGTYAIPKAWRERGIQRYGFHGISHQYISLQLHKTLPSPRPLRIISCHLGNGASLCAIQDGRSIDSSMGLTALAGLVMGTRSGDVDPGLFGFLSHDQGLSIEEIEEALYRESGMKGLSGISHDMRQIEAAAQQGHQEAQQALDIYAYRVRHFLGAYIVALGGLDVLCFTGGIGQGSIKMREAICKDLGWLGLSLDEEQNQQLTLQGEQVYFLQDAHSRVKIAVTRTREEWMIAQETARYLKG
ncbi:MAG: acetate/propionate family kinase [Myxococcales bacterium]|nr:acetate/propionate family kinase [Myxococcales bacterium]MCB9642864.1 acetate/propionate family kinase [Myxococcales bacterium]